jgi:hypothetical protein
MTDDKSPFAGFDLYTAVVLRWTLRDIKGKRLKITPADPEHLRELIALGLVEMHDDIPTITEAGFKAID